MAKLVIDVKEDVKKEIVKFAKSEGRTIKGIILACISGTMCNDPEFLAKKELKKK